MVTLVTRSDYILTGAMMGSLAGEVIAHWLVLTCLKNDGPMAGEVIAHWLEK
jgi:hypothetical protein